MSLVTPVNATMRHVALLVVCLLTFHGIAHAQENPRVSLVTNKGAIELELLPNVKDKSILHLQCHFGQDSLSLARMGAKVTGVDISETSIAKAKELNDKLGLDARFICANVYDTPDYLDEKYDLVFISYGAISIKLSDEPLLYATLATFLRNIKF